MTCDLPVLELINNNLEEIVDNNETGILLNDLGAKKLSKEIFA